MNPSDGANSDSSDLLDLVELAQSYEEADPNPANRAEVAALLEGDPQEIEHRFGRRLEFGTAGLRGAMGAGPMRMNGVVVAQTARAIAAWLPPESLVVIGFDARYGSRWFAQVSAEVLSGAHHRVELFGSPVPTPVVAYAASEFDAQAAIVVTASHNPATDNGYKVYAADGAQVNEAHATEIEALVDQVNLAVPPVGVDRAMSEERSASLIDDYLALIDRGRVAVGLKIAYTPLHGVGGAIAQRAMAAAGHKVVAVAEQIDPDPDFPTTPFPNPEEPGTLDLMLALAAEIDADIAIAHDPDADRLAAAVPSANGWRRLTGDEIGALLCEHLLAAHRESGDVRDAVVASTIVSGSLAQKIADHHRAIHVASSTGFKNLARAADPYVDKLFVFAYEEAYGYSVNAAIRDKDGISAALALLECAAQQRSQGGSLARLLDEMGQRHGVHINGQVSHRFDTPNPMADMGKVVARLKAQPPVSLAGIATERFEIVEGVAMIHVRLDAETSGRIAVRPSGTEPKLKFYLEAVASNRPAAETLLAQLRKSAVEELGGA